jgi:hypothetical protein
MLKRKATHNRRLAMIYRNVPLARRGLEGRRIPLGLRLLAGLAAINVLATMLSLAATSVGLGLR